MGSTNTAINRYSRVILNISIKSYQRKKKKSYQRDAWLSICLQFRPWSQGCGTEPHMHQALWSLGSLLLSFCLYPSRLCTHVRSLSLKYIFKKKKEKLLNGEVSVSNEDPLGVVNLLSETVSPSGFSAVLKKIRTRSLRPLSSRSLKLLKIMQE